MSTTREVNYNAAGLAITSTDPAAVVTFDNPFYETYGGHGLQGSNVLYASNGVYVGYNGEIYKNRQHMDPWVPGFQRAKEFPTSSANCPALPKAKGAR